MYTYAEDGSLFSVASDLVLFTSNSSCEVYTGDQIALRAIAGNDSW